MKKDIRAIKVRDIVYFRSEDVADYIRELGSGEETDVKNRLNEAAKNILEAK